MTTWSAEPQAMLCEDGHNKKAVEEVSCCFVTFSNHLDLGTAQQKGLAMGDPTGRGIRAAIGHSQDGWLPGVARQWPTGLYSTNFVIEF